VRSYKDPLQQARRALRPSENAYERFLRRRDRKRRNNRIAAGVLSLVIASGGLLAVVSAFTNVGEVAGPSRKCVPSPPGLVGWWPGDASASDAAGGRDAILHGDATFGPGLVGQAFVLDGNGDFVSVPNDPALNAGTGDFSVAWWAMFDATEGESVLLEKWIQGSLGGEDVTGWTVTMSATRVEGTVVDTTFTLETTGGFSVKTPALRVDQRTWIHFAVRRRGNTFEILMNGEVVGSKAAPKATVIDLDSPASLKFGHRGGPEDTPGSVDDRGLFLDGRIDEVRLFVGRAVSNNEIRAMIQAEANRGRC
jgi:Concanavalin A-like lectin/glucanases superfamily